MIKTVMMLVVLFGMGAAMAGCNTVEGAGRDTERAGENIQDAANDARR
jgi:predicted small secreted protein